MVVQGDQPFRKLIGGRVWAKALLKLREASVDARLSGLREGKLLPLMERIFACGLIGQGLSPFIEGLLALFSCSSSTI